MFNPEENVFLHREDLAFNSILRNTGEKKCILRVSSLEFHLSP